MRLRCVFVRGFARCQLAAMRVLSVAFASVLLLRFGIWICELAVVGQARGAGRGLDASRLTLRVELEAPIHLRCKYSQLNMVHNKYNLQLKCYPADMSAAHYVLQSQRKPFIPYGEV